MYEFVQENGAQARYGTDLRKLVRSHVMKDFRRKQREFPGKAGRNDDPRKDDSQNQGPEVGAKTQQRPDNKNKESRVQTRPSGPDYTLSPSSPQHCVQVRDQLPCKMAEETHLVATITHLDLRPVRRMQIFSHFFESHLPSANAEEVRRARYISFLSHIPYLTNPSSLLRNAVDAVCFAHVGIRQKDRRLIQASHNSYGLVLSRIREMVGNPGMRHGLTPTETIVSIMLAGLFDEAMPWYHRTTDNSYMTHIWGAQQYLGACDPKEFDLTQPLDRSAVHHVFQASYWLGIARREALSFRTPSWTKAELAIWPNRKWYHTYESIPGLLERTDLLLDGSKPGSDQDLIALCQDIIQIRESIRECRQPELHTPVVIKLCDYARFDIDIEEHRFFSTNTTFTELLTFGSPESAVNSASLAILFLLIDCTLLRILHFRSDAQEAIINTVVRTTEAIETDATSFATQLCQDTYYFSTLESEAYADFQKLMLRCARNYFEEQSMKREMLWCEGCSSATKSRIERIRTKRPPTLCRISGLQTGLEDASRFRTRSAHKETRTSREPRECPFKVPHGVLPRSTK